MTTSTAALFDWLEANAHNIRWMPEAGQAHDELRYAARHLERAVDRHPARAYAGICNAPVANGTCKRPLYRWPESDHVKCDGHRPGQAPGLDVGCRHVHSRADRDTWLLGELDYALLPLDLWQKCLPDLMPDLTWPARGTYWRWVQVHRLTAKAVVNGVEHFSGADIIELVTREQLRIRGNIAGHARKMSA